MPTSGNGSTLPEDYPSPRVNNFSITIATVNGTGSHTANIVLLRALFRMGIPVSGKNVFPSNIQGLPAWFSIRVNPDGYTARCDRPEILVLMNKATVRDDLMSLAEGGICIHPDTLPVDSTRADILFCKIPADRLARDTGVDAALRPYVANMAYVGCLAWLLRIDRAEIRAALEYFFKGKPSAVDLNAGVVEAAYQWAEESLPKDGRFRVERMAPPDGLILTEGNIAAALGAIWGGVTFAAWYPITPASSLSETLQEYLPQLRKDPRTGRNTFAVVQAEDEIAALGMAVGAGWMGARSMTATSGPGLSLMAEYIGLADFAEVPVVIWDVQRQGPSTGLPTRTAQGDLQAAYHNGHGDGRHVVLLPAAEECFEFGWRAFDLAERLQSPVLVLIDLDLGLNLWRIPAFRYPDAPMDRGKVLTAEDLEKAGEFARYRDDDHDGIAPRTLPGTRHPLAAYFSRGTGHDERAGYSERPEVWEANTARLQRKFATARRMVPAPVTEKMPGAQVGIIAFGSTDPAVQEARAMLAEEGVATDYLRLRALPVNGDTGAFILDHERTYVVEMNADGQLCGILRAELPELAARMIPATHNDGLPLTAAWIAGAIRAAERRNP